MPFLESQTCDVTRPWSLSFPAPRAAAAFRQRQALSTWLPGFLMLLVHSGCIRLWISPFILHTNGALHADESHLKHRGNFQPMLWRHGDEQCERSMMVHLQMSRVPQTSVLRVPVQALLTARAPAAGQHQPRCCQQLAAIPLWSHQDRELWGLYNVSVSDKWKRRTSVWPCTCETEKEVELFKIYRFIKGNSKTQMFPPVAG